MKKKYLSSQVKAVNKDGSIRFRLTNLQVDRHGEVVVPDGVNLKEFKQNPIVLFGHGMMTNVPIGKFKPDSFKVTKNYVDGDIIFDEEGKDPFAEMIGDKVRNGFLNKGSIGFFADQVSNELVLPKQTGVTIQKWTPLEFSIVPIPSNTGATVLREFYDECKSLLPDLDDNIFTPPFKIESVPGVVNDESMELLEKAEIIIDEVKAGRVLSSKNRTLVKNVADNMRSLLEELDTLLEATEVKPNDDDKANIKLGQDEVIRQVINNIELSKLVNNINDLKGLYK